MKAPLTCLNGSLPVDTRRPHAAIAHEKGREDPGLSGISTKN